MEENNHAVLSIGEPSDKSPIEKLKLLHQIETAVRTRLIKEEKLWAKIATTLRDLVKEWYHLMSPNIVDTCIRRVINKVSHVVILDLIYEMFENGARFSSEPNKEEIQKTIQSIRNEIMQSIYDAPSAPEAPNVSDTSETLYIKGEGVDTDRLQKIIDILI